MGVAGPTLGSAEMSWASVGVAGACAVSSRSVSLASSGEPTHPPTLAIIVLKHFLRKIPIKNEALTFVSLLLLSLVLVGRCRALKFHNVLITIQSHNNISKPAALRSVKSQAG